MTYFPDFFFLLAVFNEEKKQLLNFLLLKKFSTYINQVPGIFSLCLSILKYEYIHHYVIFFFLIFRIQNISGTDKDREFRLSYVWFRDVFEEINENIEKTPDLLLFFLIR